MNLLHIIRKALKLLLVAVILIVVYGILQTFFIGSEKPPVDHAVPPTEDQLEMNQTQNQDTADILPFTLADLPPYSGIPYTEVHDNQPYFDIDGKQTSSYDSFSPLDSLGRCGPAIACIGTDIMPDKPREAIGMIKPSGWHTVKYNDLIEDNYLYNRCHLIGYQLTGQNANEKNLITGTRYMNAQGMEPYESMIASYVRTTGNHVLYRVTPIFEGKNLVASGVLMEAFSVEDQGQGICFNIFCYNVQPGIQIDYRTGDSSVDQAYDCDKNNTGHEDQAQDKTDSNNANQTHKQTDSEHKNQAHDSVFDSYETLDHVGEDTRYVLNTNSMKFHLPTCKSVFDIKITNVIESREDRDTLMEQGYVPCKNCNP